LLHCYLLEPGAVIIAIGLVRGDSVFRGDFTIVSIFFDALGVIFIIRGLLSIYQSKQQAAVPPASPPAPRAPAPPPPRR